MKNQVESNINTKENWNKCVRSICCILHSLNRSNSTGGCRYLFRWWYFYWPPPNISSISCFSTSFLKLLALIIAHKKEHFQVNWCEIFHTYIWHRWIAIFGVISAIALREDDLWSNIFTLLPHTVNTIEDTIPFVKLQKESRIFPSHKIQMVLHQLEKDSSILFSHQSFLIYLSLFFTRIPFFIWNSIYFFT